MRIGLLGLVLSLWVGTSCAQSVHLSQYYNAPTLISPANTGLTPEHDYRVGLNYRNQWSSLPVPFNTFAAWGDLKIGGNKDEERHNWLGLGGAIYSDKAGDGQLKLTQFQGSLAYHIQLNSAFMVSLGMSAASVQRSVNYDLLTYDAQWDGFAFNSGLPSGERLGIIRASYYTIGAGVNFSIIPNENVFIKLGGGAVNINKPVESFYAGGKNTLALRPSGTLDILIRTGDMLMVNPSVYYTQQSTAQELVAGTMVRMVLAKGGGAANTTPFQLLLGGYYRMADAMIGAAGLEIGPVQFVTTYDMTMSTLAPYNGSRGALEFSLIYQGDWGRNRNNAKRSYTCPRFN
jgi:type IX secretion system PorP/SprF family membrane protein